jgi:sugar phosphate isomerase/epimerase
MPNSYRYCMFTKHLQSIPMAEAARTIKDLGFEGADLTARPGGYIPAERVPQDLPTAVRTFHDWGLQVPLLTTSITTATDPAAAPTFETAKACGIPEIKLGYVKYTTFGTYQSLVDQAAKDLDGIEQLAARTGVRANLHVHSESTLTAIPAIIWYLIKDRNPAHIGAYVDPGHMTVEGGGEGWRIGLDLLKNHLSLVAIKDFAWEQVEDPALGKPRYTSKLVPLSEGMVPWPRVFDCLRAANFSGWLSLHSEYQGPRSRKQLSLQDLITQTRLDLAYLKSVADRSETKN